MGTRDKHDPGIFSWVDLATTDLAGAKDFYGKVFGWDFEDSQVGDDQVYSMATIDGRHVCGLSEADGPPRWNSYVTVESVEDATKKAQELGANVHAPPFDVMEAGRMSVIQDPSGAVVALWEPKENPGAGIVNVHGALTWNDLQTHDVEKASDFYCELFGWEVAPVSEDAGNERLAIRSGERLNGGMAKMPEAVGTDVPPHWLAYFAVDDIEAFVAAVRAADGEVIAGPIDIPTGQLAVLADPQGATFGVAAGEFDD